MSCCFGVPKDDLLLQEEIERSGVQADLEDENKELDTALLDSIVWTPSARGEPGKTPRDLAFVAVSSDMEDDAVFSDVGLRPNRTWRFVPDDDHHRGHHRGHLCRDLRDHDGDHRLALVHAFRTRHRLNPPTLVPWLFACDPTRRTPGVLPTARYRHQDDP